MGIFWELLNGNDLSVLPQLRLKEMDLREGGKQKRLIGLL